MIRDRGMKAARVLLLMLFSIAAIVQSLVAWRNARAVNGIDLPVEDDDDSLAQYIFELFRRGLEVGVEEPQNQIADNGLLLIRGAKFRTVSDGIGSATGKS